VLEHHLSRKIALRVTFLPPLYACLPAHTTVNIPRLASVCLDNLAADTRDAASATLAVAHCTKKHCNVEFRVPGARRTSLHSSAFNSHDIGSRSSQLPRQCASRLPTVRVTQTARSGLSQRLVPHTLSPTPAPACCPLRLHFESVRRPQSLLLFTERYHSSRELLCVRVAVAPAPLLPNIGPRIHLTFCALDYSPASLHPSIPPLSDLRLQFISHLVNHFRCYSLHSTGTSADRLGTACPSLLVPR